MCCTRRPKLFLYIASGTPRYIPRYLTENRDIPRYIFFSWYPALTNILVCCVAAGHHSKFAKCSPLCFLFLRFCGLTCLSWPFLVKGPSLCLDRFDVGWIIRLFDGKSVVSSSLLMWDQCPVFLIERVYHHLSVQQPTF